MAAAALIKSGAETWSVDGIIWSPRILNRYTKCIFRVFNFVRILIIKVVLLNTSEKKIINILANRHYNINPILDKKDQLNQTLKMKVAPPPPPPTW